MAFVVGKLVAVIAICLSINVLLCSGRKKPSIDVVYECVRKQLCTCKIPERFKDCYEHLTGPSQKWLVDKKLDSCNMVNLEYDDITKGLQDSCSIDDKEFKPCYDEIFSHYKKRYSEIVTGMHGPDEGGAFEKARACLEAIINFCESNPDGCVSVG